MTSVPVMSVDAFCASAGVGADVVRGWIQRGYVPTVKVGRYRLINVEAIRRRALEHGESFVWHGATGQAGFLATP